jgi:hypothetical protein
MEPITLLLILLAANAITILLATSLKKFVRRPPPREEPPKGKVNNPPPPPFLFIETPDGAEGRSLGSQLISFPYYSGYLLPNVIRDNKELKEGDQIQFEVTVGKMLENQENTYRAINLKRLHPQKA